MPLLLELCAAGLADCLAAQAGGADRIELNVGLELGGLTPSVGLLEVVKAAVDVPVVVMLRPRPGGFCYDEPEFRTMLRDAALLRAHGADGLAFGVLTPERGIDVDRCRRLVEAAGAGETVFHRAFDVVAEPERAIDALMDLGVTRVLTSGRAARALDGAERIAAWRARSGDRLQWLPGAGIRPENVAEVVRRTGCDQVHASLSGRRTDPTAASGAVSFAPPGAPAPDAYTGTSAARVAAMRRALDALSDYSA